MFKTELVNLFKGFGWRTHVEQNYNVNNLEVCYILKEGPGSPNCFGFPIDDRKTKTRLKHVLEWAYKQFEPPKSYKILGKEITPSYSINYINRAIVSDIFGTKEQGFRADIMIQHPTTEEQKVHWWCKDELPLEIQNLLQLIDEYVWQKTIEHLEDKFGLSKKSISRCLYEHVFIAYKAGGIGESIAEKLAKFLYSRKINIWYFKWRVGWGDSITDEEEKALMNAFAAVIVLTSDFLKGNTAKEEYKALIAKKREDKEFKVGLLIVGDEVEIPQFLKDYLYVKINGIDDPNFNNKCEEIYRGILLLPSENSLPNN